MSDYKKLHELVNELSDEQECGSTEDRILHVLHLLINAQEETAKAAFQAGNAASCLANGIIPD